MNITSGIGIQTQALSTPTPAIENVKKVGGDDGATSAVSSQKDVAQLTPAAGLLMQALSAPDVRAERVAAIQQSIADGTYNVPASAVADKVIESMLG